MDQDHQQQIDELLERYLNLLDEYTSLRASLSKLQSSMYQDIARANFSGERGMRYGQDHYDQRMQASRVLAIEMDEHQLPKFSVVDVSVQEKKNAGPSEGNGGASKEEDEQSEAEEERRNTAQKAPKKNRNPLQWFGFFAPRALQAAQAQSIVAVDQVVPRLVSVSAEMLQVEIEVRRARKHRAKAEARVEKNTEESSSVPGKQHEPSPISTV